MKTNEQGVMFRGMGKMLGQMKCLSHQLGDVSGCGNQLGSLEV